MQTFTFFMIDGLRATPSFLFDEFKGPDEALEFARDLLSVTGYSGIEVLRGDEKIGVVERGQD